jgi:hypothetical protein
VENGVPTAHVITLPGANHYVFLSNEAEVLREQGPPAERHTRAGGWPDQKECTLSRARPGLSCFFLDR